MQLWIIFSFEHVLGHGSFRVATSATRHPDGASEQDLRILPWEAACGTLGRVFPPKALIKKIVIVMGESLDNRIISLACWYNDFFWVKPLNHYHLGFAYQPWTKLKLVQQFPDHTEWTSMSGRKCWEIHWEAPNLAGADLAQVPLSFQVDAILEQAGAPLGSFGYPKLVLVMHSPEMSTILSGKVVAMDFSWILFHGHLVLLQTWKAISSSASTSK